MDTGNTKTEKHIKCPSCGAERPVDNKILCNVASDLAGQRTCPHCNSPITGTPQFCRNCGKSLVPERTCPKCSNPISGNPEFCRHCGAPLQKPRLCPSCGAVISRDAKFCNTCGRGMGTQSPEVRDETLVEKARELFAQARRFGTVRDLPNPDVGDSTIRNH